MAQTPPGPPSDHEDRPGQGPTQPLAAPAQPPVPPAPPGQGRTEPLTGPVQPPVPPPALGPPLEAMAGFWRRFASSFLDWVLVGVVAAAIGQLFGVEVPSPSSATGDAVNFQPAPGPSVLVGLVYFTYFHATGAGQSIGNKIMGIRVLDAGTGRSLPSVRAFVRALMSNLSAIPLFLGYFWMLWEPRKRTWHDIVADSLVVRTTHYPPGEFGRPAGG
jgi:uncharacterized RDD family membrane protein YckC